MKFIIEGTFLIERPEMLNNIKEVDSIGSWSDKRYEVKGEPSSVTAIADDKIFFEENKADAFKDEKASEELERTKKEFEKYKLKTEKKNAIERIVAERRGLSREQIVEWAKEQNWIHTICDATSDDVRKWLRSKQED